ncbi:protein-tyrosine phosphatase family protein [Streptomyces sp. P9-2B-2]|uniref:protein-tyrosine phosphatase family protein n=1 Tax=Streptomyces sp. P9-2B-2 TaxID=3057114 RepID=UPI0025B41B93|nr:protein-tyrosine phosphatase family protein [Streptomyces sp. P9-2B-2]WJY36252.1 protein-tyrosine phosphatase family protein [Streptomyces sp. P9-2B-2]
MKDRHWRTRYRVGAYEVWGTSLDSEERRRRAPYAEPADIGLYLDERWRGETDARTPYFVYWPTLEAPVERSLLVRRIKEAATALANGTTVEVACFGGHGRTGTVLCCLDVILGETTAQAALERIRREYCHYAVGAAELQHFLFDVEKELTPRAPEPLPAGETR